MTQSNEPNDRNREIDRQFRSLNRRVELAAPTLRERLEYAQISPQEFSSAFDRVYDEIDALEDTVNQRFDRIEGEIRELHRKFDVVMQYITGQGGAS